MLRVCCFVFVVFDLFWVCLGGFCFVYGLCGWFGLYFVLMFYVYPSYYCYYNLFVFVSVGCLLGWLLWVFVVGFELFVCLCVVWFLVVFIGYYIFVRGWLGGWVGLFWSGCGCFVLVWMLVFGCYCLFLLCLFLLWIWFGLFVLLVGVLLFGFTGCGFGLCVLLVCIGLRVCWVF